MDKVSLVNNLAQSGAMKDLRKKITFAILALIVYRIGCYIPLAGVDAKAFTEAFAKKGGGMLDLFNMFSGGALGRMTIFALNIVPYITVSIVVQLLTVIVPSLAAMKKDGEMGRKKINQWTKYGTVVMASFQAFGIANLLSNTAVFGNIILIPVPFFKIATVITLVGGVLFLVWLADQITAHGIGNGSSLIIYTGIITGLPSAFGKVMSLSKSGSLSAVAVIGILALVVGLLMLIVWVERAQRRIIVQYPKRQVGNQIMQGESNHIPFKINTAGVIPPIFASSLLLFPTTIANFYSGNSGVVDFIQRHLAHGKPAFMLLYAFLITFFCFFYARNIFNSNEMADNLKRSNGFIAGIRPGDKTKEYLNVILGRLACIAAVYLTIICVIPEILIAKYSIPLYMGGTSLIIVVNVVIDTFTQIQSSLFASQYSSLLRKSKAKRS
jgi:preprotein translocase subunit SecY